MMKYVWFTTKICLCAYVAVILLINQFIFQEDLIDVHIYDFELLPHKCQLVVRLILMFWLLSKHYVGLWTSKQEIVSNQVE